jgi:hypothetical protein
MPLILLIIANINFKMKKKKNKYTLISYIFFRTLLDGKKNKLFFFHI